MRSRQVQVTGLVGLLVATVLFAAYVHGLGSVREDQLNPDLPFETRLYVPPENGIESALMIGDGHTFAALAQDPTLSHAEVFELGETSFAYRAQRPLFGWIGWAGSLGRPELVPWVIGAGAVAGIGALVLVTAAWLARCGARPALALALLATPGVIADLTWACPEALGAALALGGFLLWRSRPGGDVGRWAAVGLMTLGGLTKETLLLVPAALVLDALVDGTAPFGARLRSVVPLLVAPAAYLAWVGVVVLRIGTLPFDSDNGALGLPFAGMLRNVERWDRAHVAFLVLTFGMALAALVRVRDRAVAILLGLHLAMAVVMGVVPWLEWEYWSRPLLPMAAASLVVLASVPVPSERPEPIPARLAGARSVRPT